MDIGALPFPLLLPRARRPPPHLEAISGQRMMSSYIRIGGVALEPPADIYDRIRKFLNAFPKHIEEYEGCSTATPSGSAASKVSAFSPAEEAIAPRRHRPSLRASGVDWDVRRDLPYSGYDKFKFNIPTSPDGDVWARYVRPHAGDVRVRQHLPPGLDLLAKPPRRPPQRRRAQDRSPRPRADEDPDGVPHPSLQIVTEGFQVPAGEGHQFRRSPPRHDELLRSPRTAPPSPTASTCATPTSPNLQALETMCKGRLIADVVAVIGSIDIVLGAIDPLAWRPL